jgi:hypothetical protein
MRKTRVISLLSKAIWTLKTIQTPYPVDTGSFEKVKAAGT